ncbi:hypothetical protein ACIRD9_40665 [Streptomyces violaceus]|uniref:hypothetical protein n=1 Tax=Streptomyces violaceus TaxID=1936 RepID=UPI00380BF625
MRGRIPVRRAATAEEIADAVRRLTSSESFYLNWAALPVDGSCTAFQPPPRSQTQKKDAP